MRNKRGKHVCTYMHGKKALFASTMRDKEACIRMDRQKKEGIKIRNFTCLLLFCRHSYMQFSYKTTRKQQKGLR